MPLVVGMTAEGATAELAEQPLEAKVAYAPAKAGKLPGIVVEPGPARGGLSANDTVTIWVSKARHGALPNFVGSSLEDVSARRQALKLRLQGRQRRGTRARSSARAPSPASRSRPGCASSSWSGTAHERDPLSA